MSSPRVPSGLALADEIEAERRGLADTFARVGEEAPTLCGQWTALDLAAHLTALERHGGVATFVGRSLVERGVHLNDRAGGLADRVIRRERRQRFETLVSRLRRPSPRLLLRSRVAAVGLFEVWMHHEDVAAPNEVEHDDRPGLVDSLAWLVRFQSRSVPTGAVRLVAPRHEWVLGRGDANAVIRGSVGDLVRWCAGRPVRGALDIDASDSVVAGLEALRPRV